MSEQVVVEVLFAASAIVAGVAASGKAEGKKLLSVATAVCLAAAALFVKASDFLSLVAPHKY